MPVAIVFRTILPMSICFTYMKRPKSTQKFSATQHDHIRTCFVYSGGVMPGRRAGSGFAKYCTLYSVEIPKQDRKRFHCQVRRNTLPIWVCYLSMLSVQCPVGRTWANKCTSYGSPYCNNIDNYFSAYRFNLAFKMWIKNDFTFFSIYAYRKLYSW